MRPDSSSSTIPTADGLWSGCHGVRLRPDGLAAAYGSCRGTPLVEAALEEGRAGQPGVHEVWHLTGETSLADGPVAYDQRLTRRTDGAFVLEAEGASLRIDARRRLLVVDCDRESLALQLVTTYGLPLLLDGLDVLLLHACAGVPPGGTGAQVICASSGTGKSTLLVGLLAAGWSAVSEDVCAIDLRSPSPTVWPGPPWVRRHGDAPLGAKPRFATADKTAWDIAPWQIDRPVPVDRLVFLEPAGGSATRWRDLDRPASIACLARATIWLGEPARRAAATFAASVGLARTIPCATLKLPVAEGWARTAEAVLRDPGPGR